MQKRRGGVLLQYFHWYSDGGAALWNKLAKQAEKLKEAGFTAIWLPPPAYKGAGGGNDTGYGGYMTSTIWESSTRREVLLPSMEPKQSTSKPLMRFIPMDLLSMQILY